MTEAVNIARNDLTRNDTIKKVYMRFLKLCGMGIIASTVGVVFDSALAGNVIKGVAIAAISMGQPVYLLSTMLFMTFSLGGATTCSQFIGAGEQEKMNIVFSLSVKAGCLIAIICGLVIMLLRVPIVKALGATDPQLITMTSDYVLGLCISMPFVLLCNVYMSFVSLDGSPQIGFLASVVVALSKISFDLLFCVVLQLGIISVSLTTGLSMFLGLLVCLRHFKKDYCSLKFVPWRSQLYLLKNIIVTGLPNAISFLWSALRAISLNKVLLATGGVVAMSGAGVADSVGGLLTIVVMAFGYTMTSMLGLFYGEKDRRSMHDVFVLALKLGLTVAAVFAVLIYILAPSVPGAFGLKDPAAISAGTAATEALAFYFLSLELYYIFLYTYQSTEHTKLANYIVLAKQLLFFVPLLYALSAAMGLKGIWTAQILSDWLCIASILLIIAVRTHRSPFQINNLFMLPANFDQIVLYADVSVRYTTHSLELFMSELRQRCSRAITSRTETVAKNIINHMGVVTSTDSFDIRIAEINKVKTIRMRYGGDAFDASNQLPGTQHRFALGFNTVVIPIKEEDDAQWEQERIVHDENISH